MGNSRKYFSLLAAAGLLASGAAQATLFDRGGGLLYDDVLKVTWLQDANYAKTSGYDADGSMTWAEANTWADTLVYHDSVRGVDWSDWRLARNSPVGVRWWDYRWHYEFSYDGSTDDAYNITSPNSELSYMYYVNLGLKAYLSPAGVFQPDWGIFGNGTVDGVHNAWPFGENDVGLVKNLQAFGYWSGTLDLSFPDRYAWMFQPADGRQGLTDLGVVSRFAWAVRCGDVAAVPAPLTCDYLPVPVPEPETYALFLAGLGIMGAVTRRQNQA